MAIDLDTHSSTIASTSPPTFIWEQKVSASLEGYRDPIYKLAQLQRDRAEKHIWAFNTAKVRLDELKAMARVERHILSAESEKDLIGFLEKHVFVRRPYITLLDNGNLRALWKNPENEQIGLQFLGESQVQYVLFAKRPDRDFMARSSGRDVISEIYNLIKWNNLSRLMTI